LNRYALTPDLAVVGAGPAGLMAAIEAAKRGARVVLIDENAEAGGQLFKQIHKFFGSKDHYGGTRGFDIGKKLLREVEKCGIETWVKSIVFGIFEDNTLGIVKDGKSKLLKAQKIIFATGGSEKAINFPGWTLPGVLGAGAVQTLVNIHRVLPGRRFLMVGSGNVGLIVSYQLLQAGAEVCVVVEAAPRIGGYAVHAAKICRFGVPILTSHTVTEAHGKSEVEAATIVSVDQRGKPIPDTETDIEIDTICLAVGLSPLIELPVMAGCKTVYLPELGGHVPIHDENMRTTVPDIYVAGDLAGIGEASTAMEEGRLAGIGVLETLGCLTKDDAEELKIKIRDRLRNLCMGPFGEKKYRAKLQLNRKQNCMG